MFGRWIRAGRVNAESLCPVADDCATTCSLVACKVGGKAVIVQVRCAAADACRLRALGIFEGARVKVLDSRNGLLVEVRGSRLALGTALAQDISVLPISAAA